MSTNSLIAVQNENDSYSVVWCHFDGYLKWNGQKLLDHYSDWSKVIELVSMGGIHLLMSTIGQKHELYKDRDLAETSKWTSFYHRDSGDPKEIYTCDSLDGLMQFAMDYSGYLYVFDGDKWYYCKLTLPHYEAFKIMEREFDLNKYPFELLTQEEINRES